MKEILLMVRSMEKVKVHFQTLQPMKEIMLTEKSMDMEDYILMIEIIMKENSKMI
jgi:hypothetical protein